MPTDEQWLESIYAMNGGNFVSFADWEDIPLEQWHQMLQIHNRNVERQNREIEKARRKK